MQTKIVNKPVLRCAILFIILGLSFVGVIKAQQNPIDNLNPGEWYEVPDSRMDAVKPDPLPPNSSGIGAVMNAWNGGAYDTKRDRLIIWGGGHRDYSGNEIYVFDVNKLKWERLTEPSIDVGGDESSGEYPDGKPRSRHTYNYIQYVPAIDKFCSFGGSVFWPGGQTGESTVRIFDFDTKEWSKASKTFSASVGSITAVDPQTGHVWQMGGQGPPTDVLSEYDPVNYQWTKHGNPIGWVGYELTAASGKNKFVGLGPSQFGGQIGGKVLVWDLKNPNVPPIELNTTGATEIVSAINPGFDFDLMTEKFIAWNGGKIVYSLDIDSKTWTKHTGTGADPGSPNSRGTFGRFRYIPSKNLFIVVNSVDKNVFFYRHTGVLKVGPDKPFKNPSEAAEVAQDGDIIEIDAGTYTGDVAVWNQNNLVIRGVGGLAHLEANGMNARGKGIWVVKGNSTTIENIEFSGATVPDQNGAGIRQEGSGLTVRGCYFHDNENGILGGGGSESVVLIENSEFANNGFGDGFSHNIYIDSKISRFTLQFSYIHHAKIGHNVKSRAQENYILYNRIMDENDGTSSFAIELPNGGTSYVIGNLIQQGPNTDNSTIVSYGAEGLSNPTKDLYVVNNTIVNDRHAGKFVFVNSGATPARLINNLFIGPGTLVDGPNEQTTNLLTIDPGVVDLSSFDYRLSVTSPAIDAGSDPGSANGFELTPLKHYLHPNASEARELTGQIEIGAYEFAGGPTSVSSPGPSAPLTFQLMQNYPNPFNPATTIEFSLEQSSFVSLKIFNIQGKEVVSLLDEQMPPGRHKTQWDAGSFPSGVYVYRLKTAAQTLQRKLLFLK